MVLISLLSWRAIQNCSTNEESTILDYSIVKEQIYSSLYKFDKVGNGGERFFIKLSQFLDFTIKSEKSCILPLFLENKKSDRAKLLYRFFLFF